MPCVNREDRPLFWYEGRKRVKGGSPDGLTGILKARKEGRGDEGKRKKKGLTPIFPSLVLRM